MSTGISTGNLDQPRADACGIRYHRYRCEEEVSSLPTWHLLALRLTSSLTLYPTLQLTSRPASRIISPPSWRHVVNDGTTGGQGGRLA